MPAKASTSPKVTARTASAKIVPHLWYDKQAMEAAELYTRVFPDSRITQTTTLRNTPSGDAQVVGFELAGQPFMAISAGPLFCFTPAISFIVNYDPSKDPEARKHLEDAWKKLSKGGKVLMPLDKYPFSERYGWTEDQYGVSWQLILTDPKGEPRPFITPSLLFVRQNAGRAEEAIKHYTSIFKDSRVGNLQRYPKGMGAEKEGSIMFADFQLQGQWFAAMDSASPDHKFGFNEAVSLLVRCEDQKEIDEVWKKLSADPAAEQCGWCKDKFGVSWQVTPRELDVMMREGTPQQIAAVTQAFLPMKKFDLAKLRKAYEEAARATTPAATKRGRS